MTPTRQSLAITGLCALAYLPWLSVDYDLNGVAEAASVEAGPANPLAPNHLLFRPLGYAAVSLLRYAGHGGRAIVPLQCLSALCSALAIGFAVYAYRELGAAAESTALAAILLATSWAYWVFSTDVSYLSCAALLSAAALALAAGGTGSWTRAAGTGILAGLAILAWQANVFLVPALAIGLGRKERGRTRLRSVAVFLGTAMATVLAGYLAAAGIAGTAYNPLALARWCLSYGGQGEAHLAIWGVWAPDRVVTATEAWLASVLAVWDGLGLRALAAGIIQPAKVLPQLSAVALVVVLSGSAVCLTHLRRRHDRSFAVGWMLTASAFYFPFIVWWEPFAPKWFIVPNVFLFGALAALWRDASRRWRRMLWGSVAVVAAANFAVAIWPRHTTPSPMQHRARCIAEHVQARDVFVVSDWDWLGYATYFYGFSPSTIWLIDRRGREVKLAEIARQFDAARGRGGRLYMLDVRQYSGAQADWLLEQTQLSIDDFRHLSVRPAFECGGATIVEMQSP